MRLWQLISKEALVIQGLGILFLAALLGFAPGYAGAQSPGSGSTTPATQPQNPDGKAEPAGVAPSYTPKQKKEYQTKTAAELAAVQEKITDLRMKAGTGMRAKKRLILKSTNHLQGQVLAAKSQLAAMETAPDQTWGDLKTAMDKTMDDLANAWKEAEAHLN
jgi:hypothetical protein